MTKVCRNCIHHHFMYGACWHPQNTDGDQTWNYGNNCPQFEEIPAWKKSIHPMDRLPPGPPYERIKRDG